MKSKLLSLLVRTMSLVFALSGAAQADTTPTDFEGWLQLQSYISLDDIKRYQLFLEAQPRVGDDWQRLATVQSRVGLNYNLSKAWSTMVGYGWTPGFYNAQYHHYYIDESRIWEQIVYKHELFGVQWSHRIRQEQRFIVGASEVSNRTRYQLRGSYALSDDNDFGLTGYDDFMVNLNGATPGPWSGYDRNRFFFGPYWVVDGHRFEVGYLGEHLKRFGKDERWSNVILLLATFNF